MVLHFVSTKWPRCVLLAQAVVQQRTKLWHHDEGKAYLVNPVPFVAPKVCSSCYAEPGLSCADLLQLFSNASNSIPCASFSQCTTLVR
jgi:hypothetical protein